MAGNIIGGGIINPGSAGASLDAATTAWINAVVTDGGSVSTTQQGRVDTLIKALKAGSNANYFTAMSRLWLWGGESDAHQAKIDIIALASCIPTNSPALAAGGYTPNGSTSYVDLNTSQSALGGNYAQNSCSLGARCETSSPNSGVLIGAQNSGYHYIQPAATTFGDANGNSFPSGSSATQNATFIASRTSSTAVAIYRDGSSIGSSSSDNSSSLTGATNNFVAGALNALGTLGNYFNGQMSSAFIGGGLSSAQAAEFTTILNAYMTAWGL